MIYINKQAETIYVELSEALDKNSNHVGQTWYDYEVGAWVLLSDEQSAFHEANPDASAEEVFNLIMAPLPERPKPDLIAQVRARKIQQIMLQDRSTEQFTINGMSMWLNKSFRTSLVSCTIPAEKAKGSTHTTLWYAGQPPIAISVPINWLEEKLVELELYAKATYDTTQQHIAAVYSLSTIEEIETYDITTEYPDKRVFELVQNTENLENNEKEATA